MSTEEKLYIKGFNHGYVIAKHEPDVATKLVKSVNSPSDYFSGFKSGKQEYDMEKIRERVKGISKNKTQPDKNITKGKGRGM